MATQPGVVKQSDLLNQLVLDRSTMEELGRVEVLWMYPAAHRVFGFICKSGFLGKRKTAFKLPQIHTLGASSILVHSQPEATDSEKVQQLESLLHCEVWSDAGNKIGRITDYLFNLQTGEITHYLFTSSGWGGVTGSLYQLPPNYILNLGSKRVLVPESAVRSLTVYREGIPQKLSKAREVLKDEVTQELRSFVKQAQTVTEQAKAKAQSVAEQAKEKAQTLAEQLQEETHSFTEQAKNRGQEFVEQIQDPSSWLDDDFFDEPPAPTPEPAPKAQQPPTSPTPPTSQPQAKTAAAYTTTTPDRQTPPPTPPATAKTTAQTPDDEWDDDELWGENEPATGATYTTDWSSDDEDDDDPWI